MLATIDELCARLGERIEPGTVDYARAEAAIIDISKLARAEAEQPTWNYDNCPEIVRTVVLSAAHAAYRNPNRYVMSAAGIFRAQIASDLANGHPVFMDWHLRALRKHKPTNSVWQMSFSRNDN